MDINTIKTVFATIQENVPGLKALFLITDDGFPVVSTIETGEEEVRSTVVGAILCESGQRGIKELDLGKLEAVITLGSDGYFVLTKLRDGMLFMTVASPEASLGLVLFRVKRAVPLILEALDK